MNSQPRNPSGNSSGKPFGRRRLSLQRPFIAPRPTHGLLAPGLEDLDIPPSPRKLILSRMHEVQNRGLNRFMADVFANEDLAEEYVMALRQSYPGAPIVTPLMLCVEAANRAARYPQLLHWERELVVVASLVYPCGFFWNTWGDMSAPVRSYRQLAKDISFTRQCLLEDPLRQLRKTDPAVGQTLACLLGMGDDEGMDPMQLARLQAALSAGVAHWL